MSIGPDGGRPARGRYDYEPRTRLRASGPTQGNVVVDVLPMCGRRCGAPVVAAVQSQTVRVSVCDDSVSALAGPVLKHGPRSLACVRVIEINKLKGVTKVKACACRELREDGASV